MPEGVRDTYGVKPLVLSVNSEGKREREERRRRKEERREKKRPLEEDKGRFLDVKV